MGFDRIDGPERTQREVDRKVRPTGRCSGSVVTEAELQQHQRVLGEVYDQAHTQLLGQGRAFGRGDPCILFAALPRIHNRDLG